VEDSDTQALQIRRVLERHGFTVTRAASAEAALDRLNGALPDLVVSDYHLPGMNGGELARELRLNMRTRAIPVLMLTEASEPGLERAGLESGADAYVPKSADHELIVLRIRALLRQRGTRPAGTDRLPEAAPARFGRDVGMFRRARILLVRDPGDGRGGLAALLVRDGHLVGTAADPEAAHAVLARTGDPDAELPDCVVVDLLATGFDGIALCAALEAARRGPAAGQGGRYRIIGLGAGGGIMARELTGRAYEAGVDDVVSEVDGPEAVGLRIRAVVRRKLLQDETVRVESDLREQQAAVDRARAEADASAAKAALAGALADANDRLREAQGKLVQAAKMASLGELVAGIAHEINNPLAFILAHQGTVERLLDQLGALPELSGEPAGPKLARARDRIGSMSLGLKRIQNLVLNLRKFSRLDESEHQSVDVPDAIGTVLALLTHKLGAGITVTQLYEAPRELMCQPALLNQVIMNIVGNAADALNAERLRDADAVPARISIRTGVADGQYAIAIADNGPGVPDGLRERIFEPFFTTKPVGSGTGLGLAIAYSVVQAHGGSIAIDTAAGGGACFTVTVPQGSAP
jgi:two-component system NtrC family sensor kinase